MGIARKDYFDSDYLRIRDFLSQSMAGAGGPGRRGPQALELVDRPVELHEHRERHPARHQPR